MLLNLFNYNLVNSTQTGHSIGKYTDDKDWVTFWNDATGNIKIIEYNQNSTNL